MVVLTGSNGFIGRNFRQKLNTVVEVEIENCWDFLENFNDWDKVELIIHQGAISSTIETDIQKIYDHNIKFSIKLFEKAIQYKIPVKYASSASVYGMLDPEYNPLNYYALSKLTIDYWVLDNLKHFSFVQGFRYFNVYGSGEENKNDQASPISKFTKQVKETGTINVFKGSECYLRDFICVDDVVDVVLNNDKSSGLYDLGTSNPISFREVAECVAEKYNGKILEIPFPEHLIGKYQPYTCARKTFDHKFISVNDYIKK